MFWRAWRILAKRGLIWKTCGEHVFSKIEQGIDLWNMQIRKSHAENMHVAWKSMQASRLDAVNRFGKHAIVHAVTVGGHRVAQVRFGKHARSA
jgi:hypothetical protein